ncbi:hypothetical protein, partial [Leptospira borgpetersenii]|uniref:hypothetical protein n=1 Tax=Leptospira borgpetersenii TaxID=174 RepID=UPI0027DC810F
MTPWEASTRIISPNTPLILLLSPPLLPTSLLTFHFFPFYQSLLLFTISSLPHFLPFPHSTASFLQPSPTYPLHHLLHLLPIALLISPILTPHI